MLTFGQPDLRDAFKDQFGKIMCAFHPFGHFLKFLGTVERDWKFLYVTIF